MVVISVSISAHLFPNAFQKGRFNQIKTVFVMAEPLQPFPFISFLKSATMGLYFRGNM